MLRLELKTIWQITANSVNLIRCFITSRRSSEIIFCMGALVEIFQALDAFSLSYITTDGQSSSLSWRQAPIWDPRPIFLLLSLIIFRRLQILLTWGRPLWREVGSVVFSCWCSLSRAWVPRDSDSSKPYLKIRFVRHGKHLFITRPICVVSLYNRFLFKELTWNPWM
jgi:hypothetical protein